ncbi:MAG: aldehyde dehydrogenase family protein [Candidatus Hydrogenedentota bacterium]
MFLNGKRINKKDNVKVLNPYNNQVIDEVGLADENDLQVVIDTAKKGFNILKEMPVGKRAEILERASLIMLQKKEEFSKVIAQEVGKTINEARLETERAAFTLKLSAIAGLKLGGETVRFDLSSASKKMGFYSRVPLGIVLAISPFNFPLNLSCHKIGPAIAASNAVVHKPATKTPLCAMMLAETLIEAGLPPLCISVIVGYGNTIGLKLVKSPDIRKISFTGSLEVGETIMANCGMKKVTMELGSNSAVVVFKDAMLDYAAKRIRKGGYTLAGQVCISVQRVYVEESIAREFLQLLTNEVGQIKYGDPLLNETEMGPMIDEPALNKASLFCKNAIEHSGKIVIGGKRDNNIFLPTIIADVSEESLVIKEEAFAPIVAVNKFKTTDEAIQKVNSSKYGLQVGAFTRDISTALKCAEKIEAGGVLINEIPTFRVDNMPYGGTKGSGLGREGPEFTIKEMTEEKLIIFDQI